MVIIDADKMLLLDAIEKDAERRYREAMERHDISVARAAAKEWTDAACAATQYALTGVEPYRDVP